MLKEYSQEELSTMSLVEIARLLMLEEKTAMKFGETFTKVATLKGLSEEEKDAKISQFYTDLNVDGSFATNGENMWGLKQWYKNQEKQEDAPARKKRIRRKRKVSTEEKLDDEFAMINNEIDDITVGLDEEELELDIEIDEDFDEVFEEDEQENIQ